MMWKILTYARLMDVHETYRMSSNAYVCGLYVRNLLIYTLVRIGSLTSLNFLIDDMGKYTRVYI